MCGIAGWYRRGGRPVASSVITSQCDALLHRGPDDGGILTEGDFGFGMRRLSILDVARGHQPMNSHDGRYAIVFNGEIYNHRDVRRELSDYPFETHSDTETIVAAFAKWGNDVWAKFEGMFAVAIWDRRERCLTLARDPLGIKPLYLCECSGGLLFGSELKALMRVPGQTFTIHDRAIHDFFSFGHIRRPRSIYREVWTLDPGSYVSLGAEGVPTTRTYWRPKFESAAATSNSEWEEQMRSMLLETTARHMQADVPVAAFLSGGIDSSSILAAMVRAAQAPIKAFTVGYPGSGIDETDTARLIARHLGCEHITAPLVVQNWSEVLPAIVRCYDEPFADMAAIPTWFVSKLAATDVKVVLCGEGGDELFAGYKRHRNAHLIEHHRSKIAALTPLARALSRLPSTGSARVNVLRQHVQRFAELVEADDGYQQFFAATQISRHAVRQDLLETEFSRRFESEDMAARLEREYFSNDRRQSLSALEQFLFADLTINLPSAMLTRLDRATMAHSVEARVPFLSHRLVDWALTVPSDVKLRGRTGKLILRKAVAPWLPASVVNLPKQGFQVPMAEWLRGAFGYFARDLWNDSGVLQLGYLKADNVHRAFAEHRSQKADHSRILYAITVFAIWWLEHRARCAVKTVHAA